MARNNRGVGRRRRRSSRRSRNGHRNGNYPLGTISVSRHGYGFVETEEGTFFIPANRMGGAMNGDTVEVRPRSEIEEEGRRRVGSIVRVHRRATEYIVGILRLEDPLAVVVPRDPRIHHDVFVTTEECPRATDGDVVLARILTYPSPRTAAQGYVVEVLGREDEPGMDIDIIIHGAGLSVEFSDAAIGEASGIAVDIEAALAEPKRVDLRERDVFTIDPADARDFDDAISFEHVDGLVRLGVHIADVSSYVPWDSSIDICARDRATSAYFVDRVLPMLPEHLSNDVCSLRPGEDRRTFTCDMYLDGDARIQRYDIYPSVIRSRRRFDYEEVQLILDEEGDVATGDPYRPKLLELHRLAVRLVTARAKRGGLDFESVEAKPVLDENRHPIRIDLRSKTDATSMIEEAMILANETVASHLHKLGAPCVYRIHEAPRPAALETLLPLLKDLGYPIEGLGHGEPKAFQRLLDVAHGRPDEALVNMMVLRSMERARYSVKPEPHFGLASSYYCHFTSPIRRYPDLMVHRLLRDPSAMEGQLEWLAEHSSKMERVVEEAERDSVNLKICEYLADRLGDVYEGTVSAVVSYGFQVRLDNTAEGMVRFDEVRDEYHVYDPKMQTLVGEQTGRRFRLGQRVRVRIAAVSLAEQRIDLELV